jgi:hypothetical protein
MIETLKLLKASTSNKKQSEKAGKTSKKNHPLVESSENPLKHFSHQDYQVTSAFSTFPIITSNASK